MILLDMKYKDKEWVMRAKKANLRREGKNYVLYRQKRTNNRIAENWPDNSKRKRVLSKKGGKGDIKKYLDECEKIERECRKYETSLVEV